MADYDVIVVGAGNGGLTASLSLAQKGLKVLLLERHNIPGGSATSFCRGRFEFEVALHQLSGMGSPEKPGPLRMLMSSLEVMDDLTFVEMKDLYSLAMPGGFKIVLRADREQAVAELQRRFPQEKEAIARFMDLCYQYAEQMIAVFFFRDPDVTREKYPVLFQYAFKPAIEVLDQYFRDPLLKAVISCYWGYLGLPPTRLTFAYLAMLYYTYIEFKPYHLKGGSQALSNALANRFLAKGGTVRYNCGVEKIIVEDGAVKGVITEHGETIDAKYVVANASQVTTYLKLIGADKVPEGVLTEMRGRTLSPSAFTMFIGFDCEPEVLGITESTNFLVKSTDITDSVLETMQQLDFTDETMVVSCYDVADPEFSPPGTCQVNTVTLKYGEPWLRVPPHQYFQQKYRTAEAMLERIEEIYPGARGHIEELEVATPVTHMRYLGHPNGAIYGYEQQTKDSMFFQPSKRSPIKGLLFASGWVGDCGFQPTLEAGRAAATSIIRELS